LEIKYVLDRDGTIVGRLMPPTATWEESYEANHPSRIRRPEDQRVIPEVHHALEKVGRPILLASNQGGCCGEVPYTRPWLVAEQIRYLNRVLPVRVAMGLFCPDLEGKICYGVADGGPMLDIGHQYRDLAGRFRKPQPGMLLLLKRLYPQDRLVFVGDLVTDQQAAEAAGIEFLHVGEFVQRFV
jgi:histidinol phosphatase-like enzyme